MSTLLALMLAQAAPVVPAPVQTPPAAAGAIDPARLAAARRVVDVIFPAPQREQMMAAIVGSFDATIKRSLMNVPDVARLLEVEPRARPVFDRFIEKQQAKSAQRLKVGLPGMVDAMGRAYARRFTVAQLDEMQAFFATPTGQIYIAQSATIMGDPDVSAWQSKLMTDNVASLGPDMKVFLEELTALAPAGKAK